MQNEQALSISGLDLCLASPDILYAATGEDAPGYDSAFYEGVGVYKTNNGGAHWTLTGAVSSMRCTRVQVHPVLRNTVYVAGNMGLHKSVDGGDNWHTILTGHVSDVVVNPLEPDILYAGVWNKGVFKSRDGGIKWTPITNGLPTGNAAGWIKLAIGRYGGHGTRFLLVRLGTGQTSLYRSLDGGNSWYEIEPVAGKYPTWASMVAVHPKNESIFFAGGPPLQNTHDGGNSLIVDMVTHPDHHALGFAGSDENLAYLATDGGIYRSEDKGCTWTLRNGNLVTT